MQVKFGALPGAYKDGPTFAEVLAWNHFGTETIPPRPVLRIAAENILNSPKMKDHLDAYSHNMIEYAKRGRLKDMRKAEIDMLQALGSQIAAEAKRIIEANDGQLQHNAPSTAARKKVGNKPLYETGELIKKLSYEVDTE